MADKHHVFLIPGFFGFSNMGQLLYFSHVRRILPLKLAEVGIDCEIHCVNTLPTASIRKRAERLLTTMAAEADDERPIHLVGHSTGGLDARLLLTPGVSLNSEVEMERFACRVQSLTSVSTPHYGTPVATFFNSLFGQQLLRVLSLSTLYVLRYGRLPSSVLFKLGAVLAHLDDYLGLRNNILDEIYGQLLADFSPERRDAVENYFTDIGADQTLLLQLAPEGIDIFNASTSDRPGVRYGSVISYARPPGVVSTFKVGLDPYGQATHALFYALYRLASHMPKAHLPRLSDQQMNDLMRIYGMIPHKESNDGIVPLLSQVWGEIIHATRADHHDVLGHFSGPGGDPPHIDWLSTGTGFHHGHFEAIWTDVARFIAGQAPRKSRGIISPIQHLQQLFSRRSRR